MLSRTTVWLEKETLAKLAAIAKSEQRSLGWLIRMAVVEFVARKSKEKP